MNAAFNGLAVALECYQLLNSTISILIIARNRQRRRLMQAASIRRTAKQRSRRQQFYRLLLMNLRERREKKQPICWVLPRTNCAWFLDDSRWWRDGDDGEWMRHLRMTKKSFYKLVSMLQPFIEKKDTTFRKALPPEERVAIALYRLTTNMFYRNISQQFGRGHATVIDATNDVVDAICRLKSRFIQWPDADGLQDIISGFHELSKLPMVAGAVDGSHIPVLAPADQHNDYFNYKGFYSINLQGVVDYRGRFMNAFAGFPGRAHDSRVFSYSSVYKKASEGTLFGDIHANIDDVEVGPYFVGDGAYTLSPWLLKAHDSNPLSEAEIEFNESLNTARNVVERAFGRMKARFRAIRKQIDMDVINAPDLIMACCCLHNYCEENNEVVLQQWEDEAMVDEEELLRNAREMRNALREESFVIFEGEAMPEDGETVRRAITNWMHTWMQ